MSDLPPPPPPPPPGTEPPPGSPGPPAGTKAGPGIRFLGRVVDAFVLVIPNIVIAAVIGGWGFGTVDADGRAILATAVSTVVAVGYFTLMESARGQTIGKMAVGLRVHGAAGGLPTPNEALRRNAWYLLGLVPVIGGLASLAVAIGIAVTISSDPAGRGLHDNFAGGTLVTRMTRS